MIEKFHAQTKDIHMNQMKKIAQKKALDEEEMHGQRCIESASTHNEAKTSF
jgi:hypothetical protein